MRKVTYIIDDEKGFNKILNGRKYEVKDYLKLIYTLTQDGSDIRFTLTDFNKIPVNINSLNGYQSMYTNECFDAFIKDAEISEKYKDFIEIKENTIIKENNIDSKQGHKNEIELVDEEALEEIEK